MSENNKKLQYVIVADGNHIGRVCRYITVEQYEKMFPGWSVWFPLTKNEAQAECDRLNTPRPTAQAG